MASRRMLLSALFLAALAAPAEFTLPAAAEVVLHRGNDGDPETLDPHKTSTVAEAHILRDLYEGLVIHNMKAEVVPGAAESWTISPDGRTYTFRLRGNAKWSNGDPVTAQDFVYSFRRIMRPDTGAKYANILYPIRNAESFNKGKGARDDIGVKAIDAGTLEITLERPTAYFLELLTHSTGLPVHQASIARHGKDWVKPGNMVSNGAYLLRDFVPNDRITLTRNPHFHDAKDVQIEEVRVYPNPDQSAAARRFMAGELHFTSDIPTDQVAFLRQQLGAQVHIAPYLGTLFLMVRSSKAPFNDVRVRHALAMAIDREFLAAEIWGGTMLPAYGMIPPGVNNYRAPAQAAFAAKSPIEREDEAKKLLAAAGFGPSKPLKVELRYNMTDNNRRTMVAIADQWKQIGVETTFITTDGKTHFAYLRDGGEFDVARYGWIADYSDPQNFLFLLESDNAGFNSGRYHNAEYDALMRQAAGEVDLKKRAEILFKAESIFVADMPWIPLLFYSTKNLVAAKLKGFQPNTRGAYATRFLRLEP